MKKQEAREERRARMAEARAFRAFRVQQWIDEVHEGREVEQ